MFERFYVVVVLSKDGNVDKVFGPFKDIWLANTIADSFVKAFALPITNP